MKNNTLKEYYVKLESLWNNVTNILTAINQSLHTNASEITVKLNSSEGDDSTIRIPSFLYLENKLENLSNNFSNLFNMPNSGEAWFSSVDNNMYKLEMVRSNTAPLSPILDDKNLITSISNNNFLKDLVSPRTFLRVNINNLPDNINKLLMKKYIIYDYNLYSSLKNVNISSYDDFLLYIYGLRKGIDYDEYESILETPIKRDNFKSSFKIVNIPNKENNPWIDSSIQENSKYSYKIELDTLKYYNSEDSSIEFSLKAGDKLCIGNNFAIYKVKSINISTMTIIIEEEVGHIDLQTYEENSEMVFTLYNDDYSKYHYIDVPLEENPYICIFLGTIYNNVSSLLSKPLILNLNEIFITDINGQYIYDSNGNKLNYMEYYKKECTNIGDIILGLTQTIYPQLTLLDTYKLQQLKNDGQLIELINMSFNETSVQVVPINKHTLDNTKTEEIVSLHAQKNELNSKLTAINNSISTVNNKLVSTDFSQEVAVTHQSLQSQLKEYYNERVMLQKQMNSIVENINSNLSQVTGKDVKYRIRGVCDTSAIENYLHNSIDKKLDIIGIDVEYKYKSINKETTSITSINSNIFSDWNKLITIDKQRIIKFDTELNTYKLEFENYDSTTNIIKWNQIDIPIVSDEDVIIRVRYKYNIGQPFVNIYSEWSDNITVVFPIEYKENVDISSIKMENENDIISAKFNGTLITEGYQEHINNSLIVSDNIFYHMPENIYSGFNTAENSMLSLKDKLNLMVNDLDKYSKLLNESINQKYTVYLQYEDRTDILFDSKINKLTINDNNSFVNTFNKKELSIIIKNEGSVPIKLYSIFPGNYEIPLLLCNDEFYDSKIINYERVPIFIDNKVGAQYLGQWIYFRQSEFWTGRNIYLTSINQNERDFDAAVNYENEKCVTYEIKHDVTTKNPILKEYNGQNLLGYRKRNSTLGKITYENKWKAFSLNENSITKLEDNILTANDLDINNYYKNIDISFFMYNNINNNYILRYEDIFYIDSNSEKIFLDKKTPISEFVTLASENSSINPLGMLNGDVDSFIGAFLYPNISSITNILTTGGIHGYKEIPIGKSVSIPITLEYFLNNSNTVKNITKTLCFDIKSSLYNEVSHYTLEVIINNETTSENKISNIDTSLIDNLVNEDFYYEPVE